MKQDKEVLTFNTEEIDEIVEARLEEIFDAVNKELKKAGRAGRLPSGVVLVGGSSNLKGIAEFAKNHLGVAARVGKATGFGGVADDIDKPQYATAVGLMLADVESAGHSNGGKAKKQPKGDTLKSAGGILKGIFGKFKA